jgi:hypothetical protein
MRRLVIASLSLILLALAPAAAPAQEPGSGSSNLSYVKNIPYEAQFADKPANYGTDIEFATFGKKRYALAGSYYNGLQIVDVSRPQNSQLVSTYECGILQGDVQVFRAADGTRRTLVSYTADSNAAARYTDSQCFNEAAALGFEPRRADGSGKQGTFIVDITNPRAPTTVSFIEVPQGSHNQTVHPSGGWLYNSNSDLMTSTSPAIEIIDIRDPDNPVKHGELALTALPGLGTESHDITFNEAGTRAYSAALSHGVIIDTTSPGEPSIVSEFDDEAINVWHQSDPVTLTADDGTKREILIAEDEFAGAAGGPVCPSGGVHVYDVTGDKEQAPQKLGYWNIDDFGPTHDPAGTCTAHVFDIHESQELMTIAFYNGGVRVVDLSELADGGPMKAIAEYQTDNADSWSFKAPTVSRDGTFYAYGNDMSRGLDVYRYDGSKAADASPGTWIPGPALGTSTGTVSGTGTTAGTTVSTGSLPTDYKLNCLLESGSQP